MSGLRKRDDFEAVILALAEVGSDTKTRDKIIAALVDWETRHKVEGDDIRDRVAGPIVDVLHSKVDTVERRLASGLVMALPYSSKIAREFAMGQEPLSHVWEPQTTLLLLRLAELANTVVVGGAYAGDQAVPMAKVMSARANTSVHCFELNPVQIAALTANAKRNGLSNIKVNAVGLWNEPGFVELQGEDSHAAPVAVPHATPKSFEVTTVQVYANKHGLKQIDLIMLDVEGGEQRILAGAEAFLSQSRDTAPEIVFEVHSSYVDWSRGLQNVQIVADLARHGYSVYALRDFQGHMDLSGFPLELVKPETAYLEGPPHGFNMFATKRPETIARVGAVIRRDVSPKLLRHRQSPLHQPSVS